MKRRALVMAALTALTVMASTQVAQALGPSAVIIPFDSVAGNQAFPAGEYSVQASGPEKTLILIDRKDPAASAIINSNAVVANEIQSQSKLVFDRYGDRYFLAQVWTAGNSRGRQLLKSGREKEMAQVAKIEVPGQITLVAGLPCTNR